MTIMLFDDAMMGKRLRSPDIRLALVYFSQYNIEASFSFMLSGTSYDLTILT